MSFLILKDGEVKCTDEGMTLLETKKVYNHDRSGKAKYFFKNVITAIFYIYKPRGIYWNKPIKERIELVNQDHLLEDTWENLLKKDGVKELAAKYVDLSYTINDKMIDDIKTDSDELIKEMRSVPARIAVELKVDTKVLCDDDIERTVKVAKTIYIPNFDNKDRFYKYVLTLAKTIEEITERLRIEEDERLIEQKSRAMYDYREEEKKNVV